MQFIDKARELKFGLRSAWESGHLYTTRIEKRVTVNQPLVLISQIQRCGGTLLSQLLDGHPECHTHPYELHIGHPDKVTWPVLNLQDKACAWFDALYEWHVSRSFWEGYHKYSTGRDEKPDVFPFLFPLRLQKAIFNGCVSATDIKTQRDILDCYMTSYFNAWLDNHNLYGHSKKFITAFVSDMNMREASIDSFFEVYPDGKFISIVREPKSWFVSARKHSKDYRKMGKSIGLWIDSTTAVIKAKKRYGDRVYIMSFEELLSDTEGVMRSLTDYLGISFLPTLLEPTFNGFRIKADSSFKVNTYGVFREPLARHKEHLTADEISYIDRETETLHDEIRAFTAPADGTFARTV